MAKEEEKKAVDIKDISAENIEAVINSGSTLNEETAKAAAEKIAKQRKEELTERLIDVTLRSEYTRKSSYLSMKKTDKERNIKVNYLKKFSEKMTNCVPAVFQSKTTKRNVQNSTKRLTI